MPGTVLLKLKIKPQSFFSSNARGLEEDEGAGCGSESADVDAAADVMLAPALPVAAAVIPMLLVPVVAAPPGAPEDDSVGPDRPPGSGAPPLTVLTLRPKAGRSAARVTAAAAAEPTPFPAPPATMGRRCAESFWRRSILIDRRQGCLLVCVYVYNVS